MTFDFNLNNHKPDIREPIPAGTRLALIMSYVPGGCGPDNALTQSKTSDVKYLKAEFTVMRGPYRGRKFWSNMTFEGGALDEKGNSKAAAITGGVIRLIIDGSEGLSSKDESPAACAKRVISGFPALQGRQFIAKAGFEKGSGGYPDKNNLGQVLTIDHKDFPTIAELDEPPKMPGAPVASAAAAPPAWASPAPSASSTQGGEAVASDVPPAAVIAATSPAAGGVPSWMQ